VVRHQMTHRWQSELKNPLRAEKRSWGGGGSNDKRKTGKTKTKQFVGTNWERGGVPPDGENALTRNGRIGGKGSPPSRQGSHSAIKGRGRPSMEEAKNEKRRAELRIEERQKNSTDRAEPQGASKGLGRWMDSGHLAGPRRESRGRALLNGESGLPKPESGTGESKA